MTPDSNLEPKKNLLRKYPLGSFFVLSYLFFLIAIMIIGATVSLTTVSDIVMGLLIALAAWTPNMAAVVVTGVTEGKTGIKSLFAGWLKWRINPWWYIFGLAPILIAFLSVGLFATFDDGAAPKLTSELTTSAFVLILFLYRIPRNGMV